MESSGWIRHDELGYRITSPLADTQLPTTTERVPVFAALVPPHLLPQHVVDHLRQRWFNGLRWFGMTETPTETVLTWTTESHGRPVRLRVSSTMIGLELDGREANEDLSHVAPLMQALAVIYGKQRASPPSALSGPAQ